MSWMLMPPPPFEGVRFMYCVIRMSLFSVMPGQERLACEGDEDVEGMDGNGDGVSIGHTRIP